MVSREAGLGMGASNAELNSISNLLKFRCESHQIQVLYTDNTERDAKRLFENTEFSSCLLHWRHFVGCEAPIVVCLFSPQKDESWQLMTMASRAQQQVFYRIYVFTLILTDNF